MYKLILVIEKNVVAYKKNQLDGIEIIWYILKMRAIIRVEFYNKYIGN